MLYSVKVFVERTDLTSPYTFSPFKCPKGSPRLCDLYMGFWRSQNPQYEKGGLSVKSNRCLISFEEADPEGSAIEMKKGVKLNLKTIMKTLLYIHLYTC